MPPLYLKEIDELKQLSKSYIIPKNFFFVYLQQHKIKF